MQITLTHIIDWTCGSNEISILETSGCEFMIWYLRLLQYLVWILLLIYLAVDNSACYLKRWTLYFHMNIIYIVFFIFVCSLDSKLYNIVAKPDVFIWSCNTKNFNKWLL